MYKKLLLLIALTFPATVFAQRFSNYFTGTLYDSFENPSQSVFKIDTTQNMAFNFFVPNFTTNAFLTGNAVRTAKQYMFYDKSTNPGLTIGQGKYNHVAVNTNVYLAMFKLFTSQNGKVEIGFSAQIKGEGSAKVGDETIGLFNGGSNFTNSGGYNLGGNYYGQTYHQLSFTYRETLNKQFSIGFKLSALSGIGYNSVDLNASNVSFTKTPAGDNRSVTLDLAGKYRSTFINHPSRQQVLPLFKNPGASLSFSVEQHNEDGVYLMYNIKDLGVIHWRGNDSYINNFNTTTTINGLNTSKAGRNILNNVRDIFNSTISSSSFNTVIDGRAEISATKYYWLDDAKNFKYNPVIVLSKQLFYRGAIGALINNVQYRQLTLGLTTTYDDLKQFNLGGQLMIKSHKTEFFIGCEQLVGAEELLKANQGNYAAIDRNSQHLSTGFFMGFSLKFGREIQSHANADYIPMGDDDDGFIKRTYKKLFNKDTPGIH